MGSVGLVGLQKDNAAARAVTSNGVLVVLWATDSLAAADALIEEATPDVVLVSAEMLDPAWPTLRKAQARTGLVFIAGAACSAQVLSQRSPPVEYTPARSPASYVRELSSNGADLDALANAAHQSVGRTGVKEAQKALRTEMFREALRQSGGNRHAAARLLGCDRRYVLKMLKEYPELASSTDVDMSSLETG